MYVQDHAGSSAGGSRGNHRQQHKKQRVDASDGNDSDATDYVTESENRPSSSSTPSAPSSAAGAARGSAASAQQGLAGSKRKFEDVLRSDGISTSNATLRSAPSSSLDIAGASQAAGGSGTSALAASAAASAPGSHPNARDQAANVTNAPAPVPVSAVAIADDEIGDGPAEALIDAVCELGAELKRITERSAVTIEDMTALSRLVDAALQVAVHHQLWG